MTFKEDINILQLNTGNCKGKGNNLLVRAKIDIENPDVVIISESNIDMDKPKEVMTRKSVFPKFDYEDKKFKGNAVARVPIMIVKTSQYEHKNELQNNINTRVILKIKQIKKMKLQMTKLQL